MKRAFHITLFLSFIAAIMEPVTGLPVHKLAAAVFLLLSMIHTILYRKKIRGKQWLLPALVLLSFFSGLFGMIFDQFSILLAVHRMSSIVLIFFLAVHISVFYKKFFRRNGMCGTEQNRRCAERNRTDSPQG